MSATISDFKQKLAELRAEEAKAVADFKRRRQTLEESLHVTDTFYSVRYTPGDSYHVAYNLGLYTTPELAERYCRKSRRSDGVNWTGTVVTEFRTLSLHDVEILDTPQWP